MKSVSRNHGLTHCVSITSHYANGFSYGWICSCSLHELMVVVSFDATVFKHRMRIHSHNAKYENAVNIGYNVNIGFLYILCLLLLWW